LDTVPFSDGPDAYQNFQLLPNGKKLTVPVKHPRLGKLIRDVEIDWRSYRPEKHVRGIQMHGLRRAQNGLRPYLNALQYIIDDKNGTRVRAHGMNDRRIGDQWRLLANWNTQLIRYIGEEKELSMAIFRRASELKTPLEAIRGKEQILNIILELRADSYLTGPSWSKYAPNLKQVLAQYGVELEEVKEAETRK
jgi:hypothetical protein